MKLNVFVISFFLLSLFAACDGKRPICQPGFYMDHSEGCMPCPTGYYQPLKNQNGCRPCPDDSISAKTGQISCMKCGENRIPNESKDACICDVGYRTRKRIDTCEICPPGTKSYSKRSGSSTCLDCDSNRYQPLPGQAKCIDCPRGKMVNSKRNKCISCPNEEVLLNRQDECGRCPAGKTKNKYDIGCSKCLDGTFKSETGQGPCKVCPANFTSKSGATMCTMPRCPAGKVPLKKGRCGTCPPATYYDSFERKCSKCKRNTFQPGENIKFSCPECPQYLFSDKGATKCESCPLGQVPMKKNECGICHPGSSYASSSRKCLTCRVNEYTITTNEDFCRSCPAGTFSALGSSTCFECPKNKAWIKVTGLCESCPAGFMYDRYRGKCLKCYRTSISPYEGAEEDCKKCPDGMTSNKERTACIPSKE